MIARERLEQDLATAKAQREQLIAQVNALAGVVQYLESLLAAKPDATPLDTV